MRLSLARNDRTGPGKPLLDVPHLRQTFFRDGQWLHQDCNFTQLVGHKVHKFLIVYDELRHETMLFFDAAFGEIAGEAKVLAT